MSLELDSAVSLILPLGIGQWGGGGGGGGGGEDGGPLDGEARAAVVLGGSRWVS
jgi:hypothetical protein